jgi:hypothetical protein
MLKKVIAASLVTVWFAFFGVEFLWASGLFGSGRLDVVGSVEAALNSLTRTEIPDDRLTAEPDSPPEFFNLSVTESFPFGYPPKTAKFVKTTFHIYKLHVAFLL